jgi:hypothetical protein
MGGIFGSPKVPAPPPVPVVSDNSEDEEERKRRLEEMTRRRRGRASTITTSPRGLFGLNDWAPRRKTLLGE